jgi:DNA-binding winged helix-turn-helix (wHTH) protein
MVGLNFPNAVSDEKDFYGQKGRLYQIENTFLSEQRVPVLIIGERRTGKTSLMNVAVRRMEMLERQDCPDRYVELQVEPRGITSFSDFTRAILLRMQTYLWKSWPEMHFEDALVIPEIETIEQFEAHFTNLLQYSARGIFLVCIDEFDEIVRKTNEPDLRKMMGLIRDVVEKSDLPVKFFFTMTSVPEMLKEEVPSTLVSMAQVLDLRPWDDLDIVRLVQDVSAGVLDWAPDQIDCFHRLCGGHPYFTKLVLYHLMQIAREEPNTVTVTEALLDSATRQALADPRTDLVLENLYHAHFNQHERDVLLLQAGRQTPLPARPLSNAGAVWGTAARRLVKRYYLREEGDAYDFRARFIGDWLRSWTAYDEERAGLDERLKQLDNRVDIEVDLPAGEVRLLGAPIKLSAQEFAILDILSAHVDHLVSRGDLIDYVWKTDQGVGDQVIDTAFYRLRRRLHDKSQYIETIAGKGFKLHYARRIANEPHPGSGKPHSRSPKGAPR